jgi:hypothetical protein
MEKWYHIDISDEEACYTLHNFAVRSDRELGANIILRASVKAGIIKEESDICRSKYNIEVDDITDASDRDYILRESAEMDGVHDLSPEAIEQAIKEDAEQRDFQIDFKLTAVCRVKVRARNREEALEYAEQFMVDADFGPCEVIEWKQTGPETENSEN